MEITPSYECYEKVFKPAKAGRNTKNRGQISDKNIPHHMLVLALLSFTAARKWGFLSAGLFACCVSFAVSGADRQEKDFVQIETTTETPFSEVYLMSPNTLREGETGLDACSGTPELKVHPEGRRLADNLRSMPFRRKFDIGLSCDPGQNVYTVTIIQGYDPRNNMTLGIDPENMIFNSTNWKGQTVTVSHTGSPVIPVREMTFLVYLYSNGHRLDNGALYFRFSDAGKPQVSIETSSKTVLEGESVTITAKIDQPQPHWIDVPINMLGTSTTADSYDLDTAFPVFEIPIEPNESEGTYTIRITDDGIPEKREKLGLSIDRYSLPVWLGFGKPRTANIIIEDKDPEIVLDQALVNIPEGETNVFTVKLTSEPRRRVKIGIEGYKKTDLDTTASVPRKLIFEPSEWNQAQTVTLGAKHDPDVANESVELALKASGGSKDTETVNVTVTDDDTPMIVVESRSITVEEGKTTTFDIQFDVQPLRDINVEIRGYSTTDLDTIASVPRTLTFTELNWDEFQTVTLGAKHDPDFTNDIETLTITAINGAKDTETISVTIIDDDEPKIIIDPQSVTVEEEKTVSFEVRFDAQPLSDINVAITGYDGTVLDTTASAPRELTFKPAEWNEPRTVSLGAINDVDFMDDAVTLTLTATGGSSDTETVNVTIKDNDQPEIIIAPRPVTVKEGQITTFDVKLEGPPSEDVKVSITGYSTTDLDTTASAPRELMFTASDWEAKTVTLGAKHDPDFVHDEEQLTFTATGGSSDTKIVNVTITDNDFPKIIIDSQSGIITVEEGSTATFDVKLEGQPSKDINLTIIGYAGTDLDTTASTPRKLRFTTSDWGERTVTIGAMHDPDFGNDTETLTLTAEDGSIGAMPVNVTITDDDIPKIIVSQQSVIIPEGETVTFTVSLNTKPLGPVTVLIPTPVGDVTATPASLRFTAKDWNISKPVLLRAHQDEDFDDDREALMLTASGGGYEDISLSLSVTIEDDDSAPVKVSLSANPNPVTEGEAITITASLSEALPSDITIHLKDTHGTTEPGDYIPLEKITIPAGEITGLGDLLTDDDSTVEGDETFTVEIDSDQLPLGMEEGTPFSLEITITDNDTALPPVEITMSVSPLQVNEGESVTVMATMGGTLDTDVVIPFIVTDITAEATRDYHALSPVQVEIKAEEWNGIYVISTLKDEIIEGSETFAVALGDLPEGLTTGGPLSQVITILDVVPPEEDVRIRILVTPNPVNEGEEVTVTVELSEELSNDVTIPLKLTDVTTDGQDWQSSVPSQVDINAGKKSGTYRISIVQDAVIEEKEIFSVAMEALPGGIVAEDPVKVDVTIIDDDHAGINVAESVSVIEGDQKIFQISLTAKPSDEVTVTMAWDRGTDLEITPVTRTFAPDDWNQDQDVTLSAAEDFDLINDQIMVTLTAIGGGYFGTSETIQVTIIDNDAPGIVVPDLLKISEGGRESFTVRLAAMPSGPVTMTIIQDTDTDLTLDQTSLIFTPDDWGLPKTITAEAKQDDDFEDNLETLVLTSRGGGYGGRTYRMDVQIIDDDEPQIVAIDKITIEEGRTYPLHVRLSAQPSGTVELNFTGYVGTNLKLDQTLLTFTPTNWQTPQTVTLSAEEDNVDRPDDRMKLTLIASGGGYDGETHNIQIIIVDNDEPIAPLTISIYDNDGFEESGILQLPIELNRPADHSVTVQYSSSDGKAIAGDDYTASRGVVIFDPGAIRGVVEIQIIADDILEGPENFTVMLSNPSHDVILARPKGTGTILEDGGNAILRVSDAIVLEEEGVVRFQISLSHPQRQTVSAEYRTQDGTAKAGEDYEAVSGIVTIAPGAVETVIAVPLLEDGLDWEEETFSVHLMSAKHAEIEKAVGVAIIQESTTAGEGVLEAYTARFVRTTSSQIVEALGDRFRLAADGAICAAAERAEMAQLWYSASSWDPSLGELLAGCRVSQNIPVSNGSFSVWGQGAFRQFNGRGDDALSLRGEVATGMLGTDYRWKGGWLAGLLLAHSQGDGSYEVVKQSGDLTSGLTGIYPYVSYNRAGLDVWLAGGAGFGQVELAELKDDLVSRFAVMGVRGTLASGDAVGFNYHGDILMSDAEIEDRDVMAEVYRIRAGLEANLRIIDKIRPYVEANIRRDGGSAETGTGLELGGGVRFSNSSWRLRGNVRTQGLVMHTDDGFTEWGISGSLQVGSRSEGFMMRLRPSWGRGQGMSINRQQTILDAASFGNGRHRTDLEIGYGIPWMDGAVQSIAGLTQLPQGMMYRLGGEVRSWERFSFSVFGLAHGHETTAGDFGLNVQGALRY